MTTHSTLETRNINYTPFGYTKSSERGIPAYAGELLDPLCESYLLGKVFRAFSPEINRFKSSDTVPPFEILNYYAYCEGDPINAVDPSGHAKIFVPHSKFDHIRRRLVQETSSVTEYTPSLLENPRTHAEASLSLIEKINALDGKRLYQSSRIVNAKNKLESARRVLAEAYQYGDGNWGYRNKMSVEERIAKSMLKTAKKDAPKQLKQINWSINNLLEQLNFHTTQLKLTRFKGEDYSEMKNHILTLSAQIRKSKTAPIERGSIHAFIY